MGDESKGEQVHNAYGAPPGSGVSIPPYYLPTPSVRNRNNYFPQTETLGDDEMRITFMGSNPWPPRISQAGTSIHRRPGPPQEELADDEVVAADRPFALRPALVLAAILTAALFVGRWAAEVLGPDWAIVAAGAAGLADAHAGALGPATLADGDVITVAAGLVGIGTAVAANTMTKLVVAVAAGSWRFGLRVALGLLPGVAAFFAVLAVTAART